MKNFEFRVPTAVCFGVGEVNRIPELAPKLRKKALNRDDAVALYKETL
jgi:alcohol dehydrogenase YqhD (iron-dependent ADH family)